MAALSEGIPFETVALVAATPKSVAGFKAPANQAVVVDGINIGFDSTNPSGAPVIVELCSCTFATQPPGTASTAVTPGPYDQARPETPQISAAKNWATEPTVITVVETFNVPSYTGSAIVPLPLTKPFIVKGGNGMVLRCNSPVNCNATGTIKATE